MESREQTCLRGRAGCRMQRLVPLLPRFDRWDRVRGFQRRRFTKHDFYVNFTHLFAFDPAWRRGERGNILLGLDGFSISAFGFRYGVTNKLSVSAYRSPSIINRPIELAASYPFL